MAVWLVRCGLHGEDEAWDWEQSMVAAGYKDTPDLVACSPPGSWTPSCNGPTPARS